MAQFNDSQWRREQTLIENKFVCWSGTYGKDDPRKMKGITIAKDLSDSMKITRDLKSKHGNARALDLGHFKKDFPKSYAALKHPLKEGVQQAIAKSIPDNYNIMNLAEDVAAIVKDQYGSHNIQPFLGRLKRILK